MYKGNRNRQNEERETIFTTDKCLRNKQWKRDDGTFSLRLIDWTAGLFSHWLFIFKASFLFIILDWKQNRLYTHVNLNMWQISLYVLFSTLPLKTLSSDFCTRSIFLTGICREFSASLCMLAEHLSTCAWLGRHCLAAWPELSEIMSSGSREPGIKQEAVWQQKRVREHESKAWPLHCFCSRFS